MANAFSALSAKNKAAWMAQQDGIKVIETMSLIDFKEETGGDIDIIPSKDKSTIWFLSADRTVSGVVSKTIRTADGKNVDTKKYSAKNLSVSIMEDQDGEFIILHKAGETPKALCRL